MKLRELEQLALARWRSWSSASSASSSACRIPRARPPNWKTRPQQAAPRKSTAQSSLIESDDANAEQKRWDSFAQGAETPPLMQMEAERVRVQQLERARFQAEERYKRLEAEHGAINVTPIQLSLPDADNELKLLGDEIEVAQERLQTLDRDLQALRDDRHADRERAA